MDFYIYQADVYCEDCGELIRERVTKEGHAPDNPSNERTYDSDQYPKGPYSDEESDCPQHCGSGSACVNAQTLGGTKVGVFLENPLTQDGYDYVREQLQDILNEVTQMWAEFYEIEIIRSVRFERIHVPCRILKIERRRMKVAPVEGSGEQWVNVNRVKDSPE